MSRLERCMHRATSRRPASGRVGGAVCRAGGSRTSSRGVVVVVAGAALLCALSSTFDPSPAMAAESAIADHDRWSPAVALQMGLLRQEAHGRGVSNRRPPGNEGLPVDGDNLLLDYYFGLSFELMAPSIADIGGHPQPFVHVDVLNPLGLEVDIAREGSPDGFTIAEFEGVANSTLTAEAVGGQGLKTEAEFKSPTVTAGLGLSFSFDWFDRPFRIRPSLQYFYEKVEVNGGLSPLSHSRRPPVRILDDGRDGLRDVERDHGSARLPWWIQLPLSVPAQLSKPRLGAWVEWQNRTPACFDVYLAASNVR